MKNRSRIKKKAVGVNGREKQKTSGDENGKKWETIRVRFPIFLFSFIFLLMFSVFDLPFPARHFTLSLHFQEEGNKNWRKKRWNKESEIVVMLCHIFYSFPFFPCVLFSLTLARFFIVFPFLATMRKGILRESGEEGDGKSKIKIYG